jgi:murein DD-endopeptidase MepM/ murein hydrolase activator NlpD
MRIRIDPGRLPLVVVSACLVLGALDALVGGAGRAPDPGTAADRSSPVASSPGDAAAVATVAPTVQPSAPPAESLGPVEAGAVAAPPSSPEPAPSVVRFRPRDGWTGVAPAADLSVRFTAAMDHASTEAAFSATIIGGAAVAGSVRWAEGDTVLVLNPDGALPYGARVELRVGSGALSAAGRPIDAGASVTFTVAPRPEAPAATTPRPAASGWRWPLKGPITQYFGQTLTQYGVHQGLDIDGQTGDPVVAAHAGTVVVAGHYDSCGGLEVHIDHGGGVVSWYRHLSRVDVSVGRSVAAGTRIGLVGATGCATGSHLHFAIRIGTTFVDPLPYLPAR